MMPTVQSFSSAIPVNKRQRGLDVLLDLLTDETNIALMDNGNVAVDIYLQSDIYF